MLVKIQIKDVKLGTFVHLTDNENSPLWIRGEYDKSYKTFSLTSYDNVNKEVFRKRTAFVYIDECEIWNKTGVKSGFKF